VAGLYSDTHAAIAPPGTAISICGGESMPAYMIANVRFRDPEKAQEYGRQVGPTIEQYGGRYLARGRAEVVEGDLQPGFLVLVEFSSMDQAKRWYASDEYQRIKSIREGNSEGEIIFVEGLPSS